MLVFRKTASRHQKGAQRPGEMAVLAGIRLQFGDRLRPEDALDFERQDLAAELSRAGFQYEATFFSWLGVTPYLSREAFDQTLAWIASLVGTDRVK
jgi:O-methyltransferase involved in polyketide biosynthesis